MIPINTPTNTTFASLPPHLYKKQWPQYVLKLRNVYLGGGGAIYDENGELHPHANFTYNFWDNLHNEGARPNNTLESQDIKKNIYQPECIIKYEDVLEKLVISKLRCFYCRNKIISNHLN